MAKDPVDGRCGKQNPVCLFIQLSFGRDLCALLISGAQVTGLRGRAPSQRVPLAI
jgi:hypothetical protein